MQKITATIPEAVEITGLGRTSIYELIKQGRLTKRKFGTRTLLMVEELENVVRDLPIEEAA